VKILKFNFLFLLLSGCTHTPTQQVSPLRNPYADLKRTFVSAASLVNFQCPMVPTPIIDPPGVEFYKDDKSTQNAHYSIIDQDKLALERRLVEPLSAFSRGIATLVDEMWQEQTQNPLAIKCSKNWLLTWAHAQALTGKPTNQGVFERVWTLSGVSLVYLRLKLLTTLNGDEQKEIDAWMQKLSLRVQNDFPSETRNGSRKNNLVDWAALSVMAVSIATNDRAAFDWGVQKIATNLAEVDDDGFLPRELQRGRRALHYHSFALQPIMMAAFLARANGRNLFSENNHALDRLAKSVLEAYRDPAKISARANAELEVPVLEDRAWLEVYRYLQPEKVDDSDFRNLRPLKEKWLGGNLTEVFSRQ
jgi:poly(beta-D-mannuronate) lyase